MNETAIKNSSCAIIVQLAEHDETQAMGKSGKSEQAFLGHMIEGLDALDQDAQIRIIKTVITYFELDEKVSVGPFVPVAPSQRDAGVGATHSRSTSTSSTNGYSDHPDLSPKGFLSEKQPRTDVDKVACLAYYLSHYRDTPHFKTVDISKLNTEAAQRKFSNTAYAINNATRKELVVNAGKGTKQVSAFGENYVDAMPDRDAVRSVMDLNRKTVVRRTKRKKKARSTQKKLK